MRPPDGRVYRPAHEGPQFEATLPLPFDRDYLPAGQALAGEGWLRRPPVWDPWITDGGWYWLFHAREADARDPVAGCGDAEDPGRRRAPDPEVTRSGMPGPTCSRRQQRPRSCRRASAPGPLPCRARTNQSWWSSHCTRGSTQARWERRTRPAPPLPWPKSVPAPPPPSGNRRNSTASGPPGWLRRIEPSGARKGRTTVQRP